MTECRIGKDSRSPLAAAIIDFSAIRIELLFLAIIAASLNVSISLARSESVEKSSSTKLTITLKIMALL